MATSCGSITVVASFDASKVSTSTCTVTSNETIEPGSSVDFDVTVANDNPNAASATVEVSAGGNTQDQTIQISASDSKTVSFTLTFNSAGSYNPSAEVVSASQA